MHIDINIKNTNTIIYSIIQEQRTPLHYAARWGFADCVARLILSRANVHVKDEVS